MNTGFTVNIVRHIGRGDDFGLPPGRHSLTQSALNAMNLPQLGAAASQIVQPGSHGCFGCTMDAIMRRSFEQWNQAIPEARNFALVEGLHGMTRRDQDRVRISNARLPAN
ncbi:hypothetical protein EK21DRAFT_119305 [Setomelanomma holmii]|uniref:Uncharacterized protein n=1 Tax=Setomelanomma holmii TaxID=210430 RepID=A0A9P4GTX5_9PLEO|nr:hypothetical protein EK21DRAFT_119305 [Setomelanomma holmii]